MNFYRGKKLGRRIRAPFSFSFATRKLFSPLRARTRVIQIAVQSPEQVHTYKECRRGGRWWFPFRNRSHLPKWMPIRFAPFSIREIFFPLVRHKLSHNYDAFVPSTTLIGMRVHGFAARRANISRPGRLQNDVYTTRADDSAVPELFRRACARYAIILCR